MCCSKRIKYHDVRIVRREYRKSGHITVMCSKYDKRRKTNRNFARRRPTCSLTFHKRRHIQDALSLMTLSFYFPCIITRLLFKHVFSQNKRSRRSNYRGRTMFSDSPWQLESSVVTYTVSCGYLISELLN